MLRMCGIVLAKVQQYKRIIRIGHFDTGLDLEAEIGQSKIIILPLKDFPNDLPILADEDFVPHSSSHTDSILSSAHTSIVNETRNLVQNVNNTEQSSSSSSNTTCREHRYPTTTSRQRIEEMDEEDSNEDDDNHLRM